MGGMNHQPCRDYRREATCLSRCLSLARSSFEMGNVALEDLILLELDGSKGSIEQIVSHLLAARDNLASMGEAIIDLRTKMAALDFRELKGFADAEFHQLASAGMIETGSLIRMLAIRRHSGFEGNLTELERQRSQVLVNIADLIDAITETTELGVVADGQVDEMLEENWRGNFKPQFAVAYQTFNAFQQDFLASAMISTEAFYVQEGYGSLTIPKPANIPAQV